MEAEQVMPAIDWEKTTSADPFSRITWSALTVMVWLPLPVTLFNCSLITMVAPGAVTTWFAAPVAVTDTPLMISPTTVEAPLAVAPFAPHVAVAEELSVVLDRVTLGRVTSGRVTLALEVCADELVVPALPFVEDGRTSAVTWPAPRLTPVDDEVVIDPPEEGSGPVSAIRVALAPSRLAMTPVALPL